MIVGWLCREPGNFPLRQLNSVVCQPPLSPLAAIVATTVNHAAYESGLQSMPMLMNLSSQLLNTGIHRYIWWPQPAA